MSFSIFDYNKFGQTPVKRLNTITSLGKLIFSQDEVDNSKIIQNLKKIPEIKQHLEYITTSKKEKKEIEYAILNISQLLSDLASISSLSLQDKSTDYSNQLNKLAKLLILYRNEVGNL